MKPFEDAKVCEACNRVQTISSPLMADHLRKFHCTCGKLIKNKVKVKVRPYTDNYGKMRLTDLEFLACDNNIVWCGPIQEIEIEIK